MSVKLARDRRAERRTATYAEILDAAWEMVRADGLASLSMRELGARVGMRAQSLYRYFPSKHAIYDAMFAASNRDLLGRVINVPVMRDPVERLNRHTSVFLDFCVEDPVRYQLLFQRPIPSFVPSPEAYAPAVEGLEEAHRALRECGVTDPRAVDVWTAVIAGMAAQQNANDPGGDRWVRLVDEITDMFLARYGPANEVKGKR
jgi:AcrR family transcriptional regulator